MTDFANIEKINGLASERRQLERAIANFASKGQITEFTVTSGEERGGPVTIQVTSNPPDSVVAFFKSELQKRLGAIDRDLSGMGLTGMAEAQAARKAQMRKEPEIEEPKPGRRW